MELLHCYTSCLQVICAIRRAAAVALLCAHGGCMPVVFDCAAVCYQPCSQRFGAEGVCKKERRADERGAKKHTPSGALLLVPLTQRDKVDEYLNLKLSPPPFRFPFSPFRLASPHFPPLS